MWKTVKLDDIAKPLGGSGFPKKYQGKKEGEIPFFKVSDMNLPENDKYMYSANNFVSRETLKEMKAKTFPAGTIIFPKIGGAISTNKKRILTRTSAFDNNVMGLIPSKKISSEYLYKVFLSLDLYEISNKAALPSITATSVKEITISLPPLAEQQSIVAKLDKVFDSIDMEIENTELKIRNVSDLHKIFLDNALGKNKTIPLIDVCHRITDGSHHSPKTLSNEYPYITVKDIFDDKIDFNNCKYVDKSFYEDLVKNNCKPINGDLLFSKDGTVGKVSLVDYEKDFVVLSSLAIISPNKNIIIPKFLFYTLKSKSFIDEAVGKKTGAAIKRIILKTLKNIKIAVPELNVQTASIEMLDKFSFEHAKLTQSLKLKLSNMNKLKNSLLRETLSNNEKNNAA